MKGCHSMLAGVVVIILGLLPFEEVGAQFCGPGERYSPSSSQDYCVSCGIGTYQSYMSHLSATCKTCSNGTYADQTRQATCKDKRTCVAGEYITSEGTTSTDRTCMNCGSGTYTPTANTATSCTNKQTCNAGEYVVSEGTTSTNRVCDVCPVNTFSTTTNQTSCFNKRICGAGNYTTSEGTTSTNRQCDNCNPGSYTDQQNQASCTSCIQGQTYQDRFGSTSCKPVTTCTAGEYSIQTPTISSNRMCESCGVGTYQDQANQPSCKFASTCQPGTFLTRQYTATSDRMCDECADGKYQSQHNRNFCATCSTCGTGVSLIDGCELDKSKDSICEDITAPSFTFVPEVLILEGRQPVSDSNYTTGVTLADELGDFTDQVVYDATMVDLTRLGTYPVVYSQNGADASGNTADPVTRMATVMDTLKPSIELVSPELNPFILEAGNPLSDIPGVIVSDSFTINPNDLDVSDDRSDTVAYVPPASTLPITTTVTYRVSDPSGNANTITRQVTVVDTTAPVITLTPFGDSSSSSSSSPTTVTVPFATQAREPGFSASDAHDGDITSDVVAAGLADVDVRSPGEYTVSYTVTDRNGNTAMTIRTFIVAQNVFPTDLSQILVLGIVPQSPLVTNGIATTVVETALRSEFRVALNGDFLVVLDVYIGPTDTMALSSGITHEARLANKQQRRHTQQSHHRREEEIITIVCIVRDHDTLDFKAPDSLYIATLASENVAQSSPAEESSPSSFTEFVNRNMTWVIVVGCVVFVVILAVIVQCCKRNCCQHQRKETSQEECYPAKPRIVLNSSQPGDVFEDVEFVTNPVFQSGNDPTRSGNAIVPTTGSTCHRDAMKDTHNADDPLPVPPTKPHPTRDAAIVSQSVIESQPQYAFIDGDKNDVNELEDDNNCNTHLTYNDGYMNANIMDNDDHDDIGRDRSNDYVNVDIMNNDGVGRDQSYGYVNANIMGSDDNNDIGRDRSNDYVNVDIMNNDGTGLNHSHGYVNANIMDEAPLQQSVGSYDYFDLDVDNLQGNHHTNNVHSHHNQEEASGHKYDKLQNVTVLSPSPSNTLSLREPWVPNARYHTLARKSGRSMRLPNPDLNISDA